MQRSPCCIRCRLVEVCVHKARDVLLTMPSETSDTQGSRYHVRMTGTDVDRLDLGSAPPTTSLLVRHFKVCSRSI